MLERKPVFPHVIEINHQAGHVIGCNVYLIFDQNEWVLIDIGYEDTADEVIELIRELDFPLSQCKTLIATHADVDHAQGLAKVKQLLRSTVTAHPLAAVPLEQGDRLLMYAPDDLLAALPKEEVAKALKPAADRKSQTNRTADRRPRRGERPTGATQGRKSGG